MEYPKKYTISIVVENKQHEQVCSFLFQKDSTYHFNLLKNGGIFSTEEDAQAWLDAMKNARR
ncbi:hypothetical protein ACFGY2_01490 [Pasteurella multocida]|uniref:hypothetical protein n=1 Tax=Pasteurella multocida TaxID=747 RepID=UPI000DF8E691|nr:hypothetical protein [Pasteurella multocida]SUB38344.1 pyruvate kinase [Pasteurella multocida]